MEMRFPVLLTALKYFFYGSGSVLISGFFRNRRCIGEKFRPHPYIFVRCKHRLYNRYDDNGKHFIREGVGANMIDLSHTEKFYFRHFPILCFPPNSTPIFI